MPAGPADDPGAAWILKAPEKPWPLYDLPGLAASDWCVVVEGEKCADALRALGIPATTAPGGAGKSDHADWSPLAGKRVWLWPDNDDPGAAHMTAVAAALASLHPAPSLARVAPSPAPPKSDAADWIAARRAEGFDDANIAAQVVLHLERARPLGPASDLDDRIDEICDGRIRLVATPWRALLRVTNFTLSGSIVVLYGNPSSGKSLWLFQMLAEISVAGENVALLELEKNKAFYLHRYLAQLAGDSRLLNPDFIRLHPERMRDLARHHGDAIERVGRILAEPMKRMTLVDVADWIEERAKAGCGIVAVDPITMAKAGAKRWEDDEDMLNRLNEIATRHRCVIVVVSHPKERAGGFGKQQPQLAGGQTWDRASDTVLYFESIEPKKVPIVDVTSFGTTTTEEPINRRVTIQKARNGFGTGGAVGFLFDENTLRFTEAGAIGKSGTKSSGKAKPTGAAVKYAKLPEKPATTAHEPDVFDEVADA
jgi:hypothetical protein